MTTPFIKTFAVENAHKNDIYALAACSRFTLAASGDGHISMWDNSAPSDTLTVLNQQPLKSGVHHLRVGENGRFAVAVAFDGTVLAYDIKNQTSMALAAAQKQIKGAWCCAVTDHISAVATLQGSIFVLDIESGEVVAELSEPLSSTDVKRQPCMCVDISSDAKYVAGGYEGGKLRIYSVETGRIAYTLPSHISRPRCVRFNPQSSLLAVTGNQAIALYTLAGGSYLGSMVGHESFVYALAFDGAGERLLSVAGDGRVKVWSVELREAIFTISDTKLPLFAGCWVPERMNIIGGAPSGFVTAGVDRTIRWYREASGSATDMD